VEKFDADPRKIDDFSKISIGEYNKNYQKTYKENSICMRNGRESSRLHNNTV